MKKALSTAVILSLAFGFFSCDHQGGKMPARKSPMQQKKNERSHSRRGMVSQQAAVEKPATQEVQ